MKFQTMKRSLLLSLCCCFLQYLSAQDCYTRFMEEGQAAIVQLDFEKAINKYKAAKICPDVSTAQLETINQKIDAAREGYIEEIKKAKTATEKILLQEKKQRQISEANRLAFMANQSVEKNEYQEALQIAHLALGMTKGQPTAMVEKAFGDAVYRYYHRVYEAGKAPVIKTIYAPGGDFILALLREEAPILLDGEGQKIASLTGHSGRIFTGAIAPNNQQVLTAGEDFTLNVWSNRGKLLHQLAGHEEAIREVEYSASGDRILSVGRDRKVNVWNALDGTLLASLQHEKRITTAQFSPDGEEVLTCTTNGEVRLWNPVKNNLSIEFLDFNSYISALQFTPNGEYLILVPQDKPAEIWSLKGGGKIILEPTPAGIAYQLACAKDGLTFAIASSDGQIHLYDIFGKLKTVVKRENTKSRILEFSPDGKHLLSTRAGDELVLWNMEGQEQALYDQHIDKITQAFFSPDGQYLLSVSKDHTAKLWNTNGRLLANLDLHADSINSTSFSPDGQHILTAGADQKIIITPIPETIQRQLKENPLAPLTDRQRERLGL